MTPTAQSGCAPEWCNTLSTPTSGAIDSIDPSPSVAVKFAAPGTAEVANSLTHGLGFVLSLAAATMLLQAARLGDAWQFAACAVYAGTMVAVYAASTASHLFMQPKLNHFLRMLDQGCIYLFIAGTFTPIAATYLRNGHWWILLTVIWIVAAAGFVSKMLLQHRIDSASVAIPVLLGWLPLVGGPSLLERVPAEVFWWVLAGGACYTLGTLFLMNDTRHRYLHAVWHLWVIAGSACHFWAILHYVVPVA